MSRSNTGRCTASLAFCALIGSACGDDGAADGGAGYGGNGGNAASAGVSGAGVSGSTIGGTTSGAAGGAGSGGTTAGGASSGGAGQAGSAQGGASAGSSSGTAGNLASGGTAGLAGNAGSAGSSAGGTSGAAGAGGAAGSAGAPSGRCGGGFADGRIMECLDRGVVAVPSGDAAFVSFRLLGTDPPDVSFNVYRALGAQAPTRLCTRGADQGTWCEDADPDASATYFVRAVVGGVEGEPSGSAPLLAQDYLRIPLRAGPSGAFVHLAWVGDLDGDGEFDFVVDRISAEAPLIEGYSRTGEQLFRLNTGPLGRNQDNIEGGATTISNGHWDGVTVYDFDSDGRAEVAVKTANGFVFGDGSTLEHDNDTDQFVSIVAGDDGAELARARLPDDFESDGPLQCHFGVGYFDGVHPSVLTKCKNRVGSGAFNLVTAAYDFDGATLTERFRAFRPNGGADYHQIRIQDVDADGKDELIDGGYVLDDDGTPLYSLGEDGVIHGDRFHITDFDPARPGLEGFGIQQDNPNGLQTYYFDAATGEVIRDHRVSGPGGDMGRGTAADLFANEPGYEYWSFNGLYSASGTLLVQEVDRNVPWPNFAMQWDGDLGTELLDNNEVGDWDLEARSRNTYSWRRGFDGLVQARGAIPFYGDVFGDWREEALLESSDHSELRVYTTTYETDVRLYTLAHNPAYRNHLTVHGYKQSHHVDYFLGFGMSEPPAPRIRLANRP